MNCPNCNNSVEVLEKNYGALFTCPQCQAVYFINFDGQAEYSEMNDEHAAAEVPQQSDYSVHHSNFATDAMTDEVAGGDPLTSSFENPMTTFEPPSIQPHQDFSSPSEFSKVASEISDFGNSDAQIASLNYDVEVTGLDSKEDVSAFKEAIDDSRFGWDTSEIMKRVRNGAVKIEKLNPVQAFILGKRIRFLNADVKWKQNVLA